MQIGQAGAGWHFDNSFVWKTPETQAHLVHLSLPFPPSLFFLYPKSPSWFSLHSPTAREQENESQNQRRESVKGQGSVLQSHVFPLLSPLLLLKQDHFVFPIKAFPTWPCWGPWACPLLSAASPTSSRLHAPFYLPDMSSFLFVLPSFNLVLLSVHACSVPWLCWLFATLWTVAHQAPLSMRFPRQEHWSGLPFPPSGDLLDSGIAPGSPALQVDPWLLSQQGSPRYSSLKNPGIWPCPLNRTDGIICRGRKWGREVCCHTVRSLTSRVHLY